jgi:hypothetical protein
MKYASFTRLPLEAALSILEVGVLSERTNVRERIIKSQGNYHKYRVKGFIKISILKVFVW